MIEYYNGDLLESGCDIICHQVNEYGYMGAGLALQIKEKFPRMYGHYQELCLLTKDKMALYGQVFFREYFDENCKEQMIANCFSQVKGKTDYELVKVVAKRVYCVAFDKGFKTIGIPYKYGCGLAKGDWSKVEKIFKDEFEESDFRLQIWKIGE